jgi:hypothetical protein
VDQVLGLEPGGRAGRRRRRRLEAEASAPRERAAEKGGLESLVDALRVDGPINIRRRRKNGRRGPMRGPSLALLLSYGDNNKVSLSGDFMSLLSGDFMSLFPVHLDFRNGAEEFHPHESLSTPIKLLSSLFIDMVPPQHN